MALRLGLAGVLLTTLVGCGSLTATNIDGDAPEGDPAAEAQGNDDGEDDLSGAAVDPDLLDFTVSQNGTNLTVRFEVDDPDGDVEGGTFRLSLDGETTPYEIPDELDQWKANKGEGTVVLSGFSAACGGGTLDIEGRVVDASGNKSHWSSDIVELFGAGVSIPETGNDLSAAYTYGVLGGSDTFCGDLTSTGNDSSGYTGDIDVIAFEVPSSGTWSFDLSWDAGTGDYDLHIYDAYGVLASAVQEGPVQPESASAYLYSYDTYYLVVAGWSGSSGAYTVTTR